VGAQSVRIPGSIRFGEDFEFDLHAYRLRRSGSVLKLERIPAEVLAVLIEHRGEVVTREHLVERIWGKGAFLDTDNSINGAVRKIRQALKDDPEEPRFIQTITGKGYRFIAPVVDFEAPGPVAVPDLPPPQPDPVAADEPVRWSLGCLFSMVSTPSTPHSAGRTGHACSSSLRKPDRRCQPGLL
jgi:DNA-binding winged helix-turn-helix (wHTH) protein